MDQDTQAIWLAIAIVWGIGLILYACSKPRKRP